MWAEMVIICSKAMSNTRRGDLNKTSKTSIEVICTPIEIQTHYLRSMKQEFYPPNRYVQSKQIIHKRYDNLSFRLPNMEIVYIN
jgi:hypothetical protein